METAIPTGEIETQAPPEAAAKTTARRMFAYSDYVHVGDGAAECEHATDGECQDIEHFHGWCRLPNPYQAEDIRRKGLAAKARKIRELRDPESDAAVVLDHELSLIDDPAYLEEVIDEMVARDWADDYLEAQADAREREEFEHIEQDREEHARLERAERELPEDEQSDEYKHLAAHLASYVEAIRERLKEVQEPKRAELRQRPQESLVTLVRTKRVEEEADRAFLETYNAWTWFVGTYKVAPHPTLRRPHLPMWEDIGHRDRPAAGTMAAESPEVIEALRGMFTRLQLALQKGSAGN